MEVIHASTKLVVVLQTIYVSTKILILHSPTFYIQHTTASTGMLLIFAYYCYYRHTITATITTDTLNTTKNEKYAKQKEKCNKERFNAYAKKMQCIVMYGSAMRTLQSKPTSAGCNFLMQSRAKLGTTRPRCLKFRQVLTEMIFLSAWRPSKRPWGYQTESIWTRTHMLKLAENECLLLCTPSLCYFNDMEESNRVKR